MNYFETVPLDCSKKIIQYLNYNDSINLLLASKYLYQRRYCIHLSFRLFAKSFKQYLTDASIKYKRITNQLINTKYDEYLQITLSRLNKYVYIDSLVLYIALCRPRCYVHLFKYIRDKLTPRIGKLILCNIGIDNTTFPFVIECDILYNLVYELNKMNKLVIVDTLAFGERLIRTRSKKKVDNTWIISKISKNNMMMYPYFHGTYGSYSENNEVLLSRKTTFSIKNKKDTLNIDIFKKKILSVRLLRASQIVRHEHISMKYLNCNISDDVFNNNANINSIFYNSWTNECCILYKRATMIRHHDMHVNNKLYNSISPHRIQAHYKNSDIIRNIKTLAICDIQTIQYSHVIFRKINTYIPILYHKNIKTFIYIGAPERVFFMKLIRSLCKNKTLRHIFILNRDYPPGGKKTQCSYHYTGLGLDLYELIFAKKEDIQFIHFDDIDRFFPGMDTNIKNKHIYKTIKCINSRHSRCAELMNVLDNKYYYNRYNCAVYEYRMYELIKRIHCILN